MATDKRSRLPKIIYRIMDLEYDEHSYDKTHQIGQELSKLTLDGFKDIIKNYNKNMS